MRVPALEDVGITRLINGPEAFTPDGEFCLGETEVRGFFVAAGFCAHGLAGAGGIGKAMAEWIADGEPQLDLWADGRPPLRRALPLAGATRSSACARSTRPTTTSSTRTTSARPGGRCACRRPTTGIASHGAAFGEKSGWERVNWYAANEAAGDEALRPRGWAGMHWSPAIGAEHAACRGAAALFDETSFAKIEVSGPGAAELLERLCDNRVAREVGRITYTQMLNSRGGIQCDFTVVAAGRGPLRDRHPHRLRPPQPGLDPVATQARDVLVEDVTSRWACAGLWGPKARDVLAAACTDDLTFPYMQWRELAVGDVPGAGAAGDLRRRARMGALLPDGVRRCAVADAVGGRAPRTGWWGAGYRAIDSLRLEKGYRVWGADITPDDTPYEGGLGFRGALRQGVPRQVMRSTTPPARAALLPHARGSALGGARQRARPCGR